MSGEVYARSLEEDLRQLRDDHHVTLILNLLNESELRSLGVSLAESRRRRGPSACPRYNQHKQESHGGLPHRQTSVVPHVLRYAPSKSIEKP